MPNVSPSQAQNLYDNATQQLDSLALQRGQLYQQLDTIGQQANELERHLRNTNQASIQAAKAQKKARLQMLRMQVRANVFKGDPSQAAHDQAFSDAQSALAQAQSDLDLATQNRQDAQAQRDAQITALNQNCQDVQAQINELNLQYQEALDQQSQAWQLLQASQKAG